MVRTDIGIGMKGGQALRLKVFRQARLEPLALSTCGRERAVYGVGRRRARTNGLDFSGSDRPVW